MRTSCAVPGIKRKILGNCRTIFICLAPAALGLLPSPGLELPFRRLSSAIGPLVLPSIVNLPMRVNRMTSPADKAQIIASHLSRRAVSAGKTGRK